MYWRKNQGDSAKTFAVSGLSVIGRDFYGVFPLRGKPLNVREANAKQLVDNAEFNAIKRILVRPHPADFCEHTFSRHRAVLTSRFCYRAYSKGRCIRTSASSAMEQS